MRAIKTNLFLSMILLFFCSSVNAKSYLDQELDTDTEILSKILKEIEELKKSQEKTQKAIVELSVQVQTLKANNGAPNNNKKADGVKDVPIGDSMVLGNPKAPITIIKWTDFK